MKHMKGNFLTIVSTSRFTTTSSGTLIYDHHSEVVGFYETDDEATRMLRERSTDYSGRGTNNEI